MGATQSRHTAILTSHRESHAMRTLLSVLAASTMLALASPAFADDYVMMKVNNTDITKSEVEAMWAGLFPPSQAPAFDAIKPEMRDKVLRGIMTEKLLAAEGNKAGLDKSPEVTKQLEEAKNKLVIKALLDQKTGDVVTDADLKKEYDSMVADMRDEKEVRARHILVASEKDAKDAKAQIDGGKKFEDVAKEYSKDPGSAKQGGELGYFTKDKMVKEFADAAFKLKKGEVSDPVKSPFGWHVIQVEDIRKVQAPTFNEAKDTLKARLQEKKLNEYIKSLVKTANVTVYDTKGQEVKFSKDMPDKQ